MIVYLANKTQFREDILSNRIEEIVIQMATGSGKTFTAVTQAYGLIKHAGARRILFLIDRGNLSRQTVNEPSGARQTARKGSPKGQHGGADQFQQFTAPDDGRKFTDLYNVQMLGPGGIDAVCKVTGSTIQRLYSQLSGNVTFDDEADDMELVT